MPATTDDVRVERYKLFGLILTAIFGPVVAFYLAKSSADANHAQSSKGYEVLVQMVNPHEARLDALEVKVARLQGVVARVEASGSVGAVPPAAIARPMVGVAVGKPAKLVVVGAKAGSTSKPADAASRRVPGQLRDVR